MTEVINTNKLTTSKGWYVLFFTVSLEMPPPHPDNSPNFRGSGTPPGRLAELISVILHFIKCLPASVISTVNFLPMKSPSIGTSTCKKTTTKKRVTNKKSGNSRDLVASQVQQGCLLLCLFYNKFKKIDLWKTKVARAINISAVVKVENWIINW